MDLDLQKASMWKRISAALFDFILTIILVIGAAYLLSTLMGFDRNTQALNDAYARYETEYGVVFQITQEDYMAMTEAEQANYDAAYAALIADQDTLYVYNLVLNQSLTITSIGILLGLMVMEFVIPLCLGNGMTLGKKIFGLAVIRTDCIRVTTIQLFIRTLLGKYTIETMIPVLVVLMIFFNTINVVGTFILAALLIAQIVLLIVTQTNAPIHDLMAGTVVVDYASQRIFEDSHALMEYKQKLHAEKAARQEY